MTEISREELEALRLRASNAETLFEALRTHTDRIADEHARLIEALQQAIDLGTSPVPRERIAELAAEYGIEASWEMAIYPLIKAVVPEWQALLAECLSQPTPETGL